MDIQRWLRVIAGFFVLVSLALGYFTSPYWFLFTAFVGLNLLQSGFTTWCPMMAILRRLNVPEATGVNKRALEKTA
jgi:glucan phosphoethanolaminetransferase (alkaline phosphatase superfamily)